MSTDAITSVQDQLDDPNKRTDCKYLGTYTSASDFDSFISRFNHENNYCDGDTRLSVGDSVTITFGTYNAVWFIAGFDCEHNRKATDGTVYDNGYGIMLYSRYMSNPSATESYWNSSNTVTGGYMNSLAHSKAVEIATNFKNNILGSHLVNRNVLLSSSVDSGGSSNAYTWTTAYGALPSKGQLSGFFFFDNNMYDEGEANYKLPLFNYFNYIKKDTYNYWLRNIAFKVTSSSGSLYHVYYVDSNNGFTTNAVNFGMFMINPLLYIR